MPGVIRKICHVIYLGKEQGEDMGLMSGSVIGLAKI